MNSDFITLDSETVALLLASPNYADGSFKVSLTLPNEITTAISSRETRRNFARFARYTQEYEIDTSSAKETTDLRMWLLRLKGETVAVPLWQDGVVFVSAQLAGATSIPVLDLPVRYGAEWIIFDEDAGTYEIVEVSSVVPGTLTLAAPTTLPWGAGVVAYPLLFGRLVERPQWKAHSDELVNGTIKIQENSDFTRRISPYGSGFTLVGGGVPAFSTSLLLDIYPTVVEELDDTTVDILYTGLGFLRQEQQYVYQQPPRRGKQFQFILEERADQAKLERLFVNRAGSTRTFFCPTFSDDMRLNGDLPTPGDAHLIPIESTRYQDPDYSEHPGEPYIALIDIVSGVVDCQKLDLIDTLGLHTDQAITETHQAELTELCALLLGRFAESTLAWEYTGGVAKSDVKFLEQTSEYVTPGADLLEKAFFFRITEALPNLTNVITLYTSYEAPVAWSGIGTFNPAPLSIGQLTGPLDLSDQCDLDTFDFDPAFPLRKLLDFSNEGPLSIEIWEASVDNPADGSADLIFQGNAVGLDTTGKEWKASFKFLSELDEDYGFYIQQICNVPLYSPKCGVIKASYKVTGTIDSMSGTTIVVAGPSNATGYFGIGTLETGAGANYEGRQITSSTLIAGPKQQLTVNKPLAKAIVGQSIDLYPGCDFTIDTCKNVFNNQGRHRGHPYVPIQPDMAQTTPTAGGGKK